MAYPPVVVVDENDNPIGSAMLAEVWQKGLYHRIVSVHVMDDLGRILLQLRSPDVKVYPNCWDQAAGGHVDQGFSYEQTAAAEISEELGIHSPKLKVIDTYLYNNKDGERIINQFVRVYLAQIPHSTKLNPEAKEVRKLQWFTKDELKALISEQGESLTTGFLHELRTYFSEFVN